ncbi:MAG: hypothetical protein LQ341_000218 [Variospora aurantia]|nr:MAG: hypothetical protein LQ341_000218 [Variospora aurantia]
MPKEHRKRGRREEQKRKREQEADYPMSKRQRSDEDQKGENFVDDDFSYDAAEHIAIAGPGDIPFYGLLDDEEQEYFKRADTMLELDQFSDAEQRDLFLANIYQEASGKELKIANSQSCSRLMERLILLSTPEQLKALFEKFSGHFLNLAQHRFASHCCETLFLQAAPIVGEESLGSGKAKPDSETKEPNTVERMFLDASKEFETHLGYLMTDTFASHTIRVLLVVLSGRPLVDAQTTSLLQSKKKENIKLASGENPLPGLDTVERIVPNSFDVALDRIMKGIVAGMDTTSLRALASHPIANPLLQLVLDLEFRQSGKSNAKDTTSLFRKMLPDNPPEEGTESASFFSGILYDPIGSRLSEVLVTNSPGKTFKVLYQTLFRKRLPSLAKNETASYVLVKALERLNREDLREAVTELCPQIQLLVDRSRTSVIKCLVGRCQVRGVDSHPLAVALEEAYGQNPQGKLKRMLRLDPVESENLSDERRKQIDHQDATKAHVSLLAQSMLEVPGPLRELITEGILAMENPDLLLMAKDRSATHVLQKSLTCTGDTAKYRRMIMPRLITLTLDLVTDPVGSHVVDAYWQGSKGLSFLREKVPERLLQHEASLRDSVPGRAVWRNWKMDMYKTRLTDWMREAKGRIEGTKTGIELARERYATRKQHQPSREKQGVRRQKTNFPRTDANAIVAASQG